MKRLRHYILSIILLVILLFILIKGVKLKEYVEVELNGNILCLSCIGIE
ncbi:MAG: hypothetical protein QMD82_05825 [bacterium]|nr:hypothetical protein [bacterium]